MAPGMASAPAARRSACTRFAPFESSGTNSLRRSRAATLRGTTCATPFLVRLPGIVQLAKSSEISCHAIPATSPRPWPVTISSRMIVPGDKNTSHNAYSQNSRAEKRALTLTEAAHQSRTWVSETSFLLAFTRATFVTLAMVPYTYLPKSQRA
jgi:hypothetical protein